MLLFSVLDLVIAVLYGLLRSAPAPVMANKLPIPVCFNTSRGLYTLTKYLRKGGHVRGCSVRTMMMGKVSARQTNVSKMTCAQGKGKGVSLSFLHTHGIRKGCEKASR